MKRVQIETGARLHFGLLCAGRGQTGNFGGVGLMIRRPGWTIDVRQIDDRRHHIEWPAESLENRQQLTNRVMATLERLQQSSPTTGDSKYNIVLQQIIPSHCGFGAGTQLAIALTMAVRILQGIPRCSASSAAADCGRAQRSAVGTRGFDTGGFLFDSGDAEPDIDKRVRAWPIPDAWRFVVVRRPARTGLSGLSEVAVFRKNLLMPATDLDVLQSLIHDSLIPAVQRSDFTLFAAALADYGRHVGEFFAAEQGSCFSDPFMHSLAESLRAHKLPEPVQSSWGPAAVIPAESQSHSEEILALVRSRWSDEEVRSDVTEAMSHGATIRTVAPESSSQRTLG